MTNTDRIVWGPKGRGRKADRGHTLVRTGEYRRDPFGKVRYHGECQCGHRMGAWAFSTLVGSHSRHQRNTWEATN